MVKIKDSRMWGYHKQNKKDWILCGGEFKLESSVSQVYFISVELDTIFDEVQKLLIFPSNKVASWHIGLL